MSSYLEDYEALAATAAVLQSVLPEFRVRAEGANYRGQGPFTIKEPPFLAVELPRGMERLRPALMRELKQRMGLSLIADEREGVLRTAPEASTEVIKTLVRDMMHEDPGPLDTLTLKSLREASVLHEMVGERTGGGVHSRR